MKKHPVSEYSLKRFMAGTSSRVENHSIVAHLLHGCASCAATLTAALRPEIPASAYDAVFDRLATDLPMASVLAFEPRPALAASSPLAPRAARGRR
jgi:hypothetical protein